METNELGKWAKDKLENLAGILDKKLENYWDEEIGSNFGFNETQRELVKNMLLHGKEHNLRKAKRLRGAFVYYGFKLGGRNIDERIWPAAEAVELVHTALLMHDDFMDRDLVRRGGPTTQVYFANGDEHYGESMAVCLGDAILCLGFERLNNCGFDPILVNRASQQFTRGITNTALGQAYDTSLSKMKEMTEEMVMSLHRAKTGIYTYENPLMIGGILSGLDDEVMNVLREYAIAGGIAFQLQDDILGIFGNEEKTGKSANSDLLQGKVTLLIVKLMENGTEEQKQVVKKVWGKLEAANEDIEAAKLAIKESGAYEYSVAKAKEYAENAATFAANLRKFNLDKESIDFLEGIARYMVEREV